MGQEEKQEFSPPSLPVLSRLDRLDRLLQFLEEKHSSSGKKHIVNSVVRKTEAEDQCKSLSTALEEVQSKGTLMERLEMLENRVLQLSIETEVENTSRSSSSTILGPQRTGHDEVSIMVTTHQEKQDSPIDQERACSAEQCVRKSSWDSQRGRRHKTRHRKWLGWLAVRC